MSRWIAMGVALLCTSVARPGNLPPGCVSNARPHTYVYDYADKLTSDEEARLNAALQSGMDSTGATLVVVVHPTFCELEPFEFATEVGEAWGVGKRGEDRGVVVVVKPRTRGEEGRIFISTGRGVEGDLTDARTGRIVNSMVPLLRSEDWFAALELGALEIFHVLQAEGSGGARSGEEQPGLPWPALALLLLVFVALPIFLIAQGVRSTSRTYRLPWWAAWSVFWAAQRHASTRFSDFSQGRGPFSGGGFGGFGGGRFGGGGAGGSF